ncbi:hypothetical protein LCGC14_1452580 [marine sediment metagenome]|uniref:Uncharacterized protein n=1 Tax=marine sediment metagenome TaxID=412755 RepID=A0A0F9JI90_9ZZZZ
MSKNDEVGCAVAALLFVGIPLALSLCLALGILKQLWE